MSVGWCEICYVPRTHKYYVPLQNEATLAGPSWSLTGASKNVGK